MRGATDAAILEYAVEAGRVVLTHDVSTLIGTAFERVKTGQPMLGIIAVAQAVSIGAVVEDLALVIECAEPEECRNQVWYLPLR